MAMYAPFFETVRDIAAVKIIFGNSPRIAPHGVADQNTETPYAVFQMVNGAPENFLKARPDADSYTLQIDVYAKTPQRAADGAQAIRDAIEPHAYVVAWRGQFKDPDTSLFRYSFDIDWIVQR